MAPMRPPRFRARDLWLRAALTLALVLAVTGCARQATPAPAPVPGPARVMPEPGPAAPLTATPPADPPLQPVAVAPPSLEPVRVPVLMYHEIGDGPNQLYVSEESFAAQLDLLAQQGFQTITLDELYAALEGTGRLPARPVVLTFDDGYASAYTKALPLLKQHGFAGAFFIYTRGVGTPNRVTWDQLREMQAAGMEIEAHTASHLDLRTLSARPQALAAETAGCRATLQAELGRDVEYFAYPAGRYNAAVIKAVRDAGYKAAVTTKPGFTDPSQSPFEWQRVRINRADSLTTFAAKLGIDLHSGGQHQAAAGQGF